MNRRKFLEAASLAVAAPQRGMTWQPVEPPPSQVDRVWIGPAFWANRLQDWTLKQGRIECVNATDPVRTLALLTRQLVPQKGAAHLSVRATGSKGTVGNKGMCGFLIGAGAGKLDWRAAALTQQASGTGGGILFTWESDGQLRFREHTDEEHPHAYAEIQAASRSGSASQNTEAELQLTIAPDQQGKATLTLKALDASGKEIASASLQGVRREDVTGGCSLFASGSYSFRDLRTAGAGVAIHEDRRLGPLIGALHSLNGNVLKLSAQLFPIADGERQPVQLEIRSGAGQWRRVAEAKIEDGYIAQFRVPEWDASRNWRYRVVFAESTYEGVIRKDPAAVSGLTIGMVNCVAPVGRNLDAGSPIPPLPGVGPLGRYSPESVSFPYAPLVRSVMQKRPDLLVFSGDQIYEGRPTRTDPDQAPTLDYLYKWYLWHWAFRELTRDTPAIVQVDDHDVYQGNIWGQGGRRAPDANQNRGGYVRRADWVNMVQRTQCGHNPDPYDPTPIEQGISVYYGSFRFGGVSFAILEDRKFKTGAMPDAEMSADKFEQLGARQEAFLKVWASDRRSPGEVKICLTQTTFACVQTGPAGEAREDRDSNGFPKHARDRALRLLQEARALILSGDQHLTHVVRHGLDGFDDGPMQFTAPAGASLFARWFEPATTLPNASGQHTGDFTDGFGNRFRVLAVANPPISFAEYRKHRPMGQGIQDVRLRADGYGVVRVNKKRRDFILECWPAGDTPRYPPNRQFAGWPVRGSWA